MNYNKIQDDIRKLIDTAELHSGGKVDAALEPIRELLFEARQKGVKLRALYEVVKVEAGERVSPSSFAKYAQRHLQVKKRKKRSLKQDAVKEATIRPETKKYENKGEL